MMDGTMSGPRPPAVTLPARQRAILERLARRATSEQRLVRRVRIVLAAADGRNNDQIARQFGLDRETVQRWRTRWLAAAAPLAAVEAAGGAAAGLPQQIRAGVGGKQPAGGPPPLPAGQSWQNVAPACEPPAHS